MADACYGAFASGKIKNKKEKNKHNARACCELQLHISDESARIGKVQEFTAIGLSRTFFCDETWTPKYIKLNFQNISQPNGAISREKNEEREKTETHGIIECVKILYNVGAKFTMDMESEKYKNLNSCAQENAKRKMRILCLLNLSLRMHPALVAPFENFAKNFSHAHTHTRSKSMHNVKCYLVDDNLFLSFPFLMSDESTK